MKNPYLCPHFQNINKEYFLQVFTKASSIRGEDKELFYFTHYPINLYDQNEKIENILESDVFYELTKTRIGNFVVAIEGETGTGKSELCIYLAHELQKIGMKVLLVDKNSDLMSILADDLPDFYKKHTGNLIKGYDNLKHLQKQLKRNIKLITLNIGTRAINNLTKIYPDLEVDPDNPKVKHFIKLLENKLLLLITKRDEEYPSEIFFITEADLKSGKRDINFGIPGDSFSICKSLNQSIWDAIKSEQNIPSLDKMIEEINYALNERWTIIFEDFSITSLDKEKLQNYLERDNINDKVNFIIAGLADKLKMLHTPTAVDRENERIKFYKTSKSGESKTLFLTEDNCIEFIRPYLCYFKGIEGSLSFERDKKGRMIKTKYSPGNTKCNKCNKCPKEFRDIFPFNKIFLKRIFKGLKLEEQKPRKYVEIIGSILENYMDFKRSPASTTQLGHLSKSLIPPQSIIDVNSERLNHFVRWYAEEEKDTIKFSKTYADLLGIEYSKIKNKQIQEDKIIVRKGDTEISEIGETSDTEGEQEFTPEWKIKFNEHKGHISSWIIDPYNKDLFQLNTYLTGILSEFFKKFSDNYKISLDSPINIRIGKNENIFTYNNLEFSEDINMFQISLKSEDFTEREIYYLLKQAILKKYKPSEYILDEILKKTPYAIIEGYNKWQDKCQNYIFQFQFFLRQRHDMNYRFIDIAFLYCVISCVIIHPWNKISNKEFDSTFINFKNFLSNEDIEEQIPDYLLNILKTHNDLKKVILKFLYYTNFARQLCLYFFKLPNSKNMNYKLLKSYLKKNYKFLNIIIEGIKIKGTINSFYNKQSPGNPNRVKLNYKKNQLELKDFFETITILGSFLNNNEIFLKIDVKRIEKDINLIESCLEDVDFKNLNTILKELKIYPPDIVNKNLLINLKDLIKKSQYIKEFFKGKNYLKILLLEYNPKSGAFYDITLKFRISLAYYNLLNFMGILDLIKKIDKLIQLRGIDDIDITILLDLGRYLD